MSNGYGCEGGEESPVLYYGALFRTTGSGLRIEGANDEEEENGEGAGSHVPSTCDG